MCPGKLIKLKNGMQYRFKAVGPADWNNEKLKNILSKIQKKKVLVVGDIGIDRYTIGSVERISPEAPVPVVLVQEEKLKLGLAANVADNIHALGAFPQLLGVVGGDRGGEDFRKLLLMIGIQPSHLVVDPGRRTVLKERVVSEKQQLLRIDYDPMGSIDKKVEKELLKKYQTLIQEVDGVILEDYAKGTLSNLLIQTFVKLAKRNHIPIAIDPNTKTPVSFYKGATVLTPNTREAEHLSHVRIKNLNSLAKAGFSILKSTGANHVVITRGKDGMAIFSQSNSVIRLIPTYAHEVYDVSGAGDTVIAVLLLGLISNGTIEEASILGNLAAGVEVSKRGTATVSQDEIKMSLDFVRSAGTAPQAEE